jgi:hypothetical protein
MGGSSVSTIRHHAETTRDLSRLSAPGPLPPKPHNFRKEVNLYVLSSD